jgi:hypothetical protein
MEQRDDDNVYVIRGSDGTLVITGASIKEALSNLNDIIAQRYQDAALRPRIEVRHEVEHA